MGKKLKFRKLKQINQRLVFHFDFEISAFRFSNFSFSSSNRIHEGLFDAVEDQETEEKSDEGESSRVEQCHGRPIPCPEVNAAEALDDRSHGIGFDPGRYLAGMLARP
jgi:hypothetical protein